MGHPALSKVNRNQNTIPSTWLRILEGLYYFALSQLTFALWVQIGERSTGCSPD
jgi:hypothetical protein